LHNFATFRAAAIRYWERRRIFWNLALVLPALIGYFPGAAVSAGLGDVRHVDDRRLLILFVSYVFAANICFTLAYVLEFLFGDDDPQSRWLRHGRPLTFLVGTALGMFLAFLGGVAIFRAEYGF